MMRSRCLKKLTNMTIKCHHSSENLIWSHFKQSLNPTFFYLMRGYLRMSSSSKEIMLRTLHLSCIMMRNSEEPKKENMEESKEDEE